MAVSVICANSQNIRFSICQISFSNVARALKFCMWFYFVKRYMSCKFHVIRLILKNRVGIPATTGATWCHTCTKGNTNYFLSTQENLPFARLRAFSGLWKYVGIFPTWKRNKESDYRLFNLDHAVSHRRLLHAKMAKWPRDHWSLACVQM